MKILHYISVFSQPSETFIYTLLKNLNNRSTNNYILTSKRILNEERPMDNVIIIKNKNFFIKTIEKILYRSLKKINTKPYKTLIEDINPDIIHAHFGPNGIIMFNILVKIKSQIPLVVSMHGFDVNMYSLKVKKYKKMLLTMADGNNVFFTSPSAFLKNEMVGLGIAAEKIEVIPNAFDSEIFTDIRINQNTFKYGDELRIVSIGRLEEVKGYIYLLRAFKLLQNYYPNSKLTIVGYGALASSLKESAKELEISSKVEFLGKQPHSNIVNILERATFYVQPSIKTKSGEEESLSVSTIEAQSMGIPCIVSDSGGLIEVVADEKTGFVVSEKSPDAILQAIMQYIDNSLLAEEHSRNARMYMIKNFSSEMLTKKMLDLYDRAISLTIQKTNKGADI